MTARILGEQCNSSATFDINSLLESVIPGFRLFSNLFAQWGIDVSSYVVGIIIFGAVAATLRYVANVFDISVYVHLVSTIEVRMQDEAYNYLMLWISKQEFSRKSHRIIASTRLTSDQLSWDDRESDDDDAQDDESEIYDQNNSDDIGTGRNFGTSQGKLHRTTARPLHWSPSPGTHFFRYDNRIMWFTRTLDERHTVSYASRPETISVSSLGRDANSLKKLLIDAQNLFLDLDSGKTIIYRATRRPGWDEMSWSRCMSRIPRPLETVVLAEDKKCAFIDDVAEYLHPSTKRWYANRGIPYRRGYMFHGSPGTGKTSLAFALAGVFGLKLYVVNLSSPSLTDDGLSSLFQALPRSCIVLLEDIDATNITGKRSSASTEGDCVILDHTEDITESESPALQEGINTPNGDENRKTQKTTGNKVSLSGLLNVLDGVASQEGRVLIMTTNHMDKIDPALLRPGRVDLSVGFELASSAVIRTIFDRIYGDLTAEGQRKREIPCASLRGNETQTTREKSEFPITPEDSLESLADSFTKFIPTAKFTPAEIQGYLLLHKYSPKEAIAGAEAWVHRMLQGGKNAKSSTIESI